MILRRSVKKSFKLELGGLYTIPTFILNLSLVTVRKIHSRYG